MGEHKRLLLLLLLLYSCQETRRTVEKPLPEVVAYSFVDKANLSPDEEVEYTLTVDSESNINVQIPEMGKKIKGLRIIDYDASEKEENYRKIKERRYKLKADFAGSFILPAMEIPYTTPQNEKKTVKTSEIFIEVKPQSTSGENEEDIRDIKPLHLIPRKWMMATLGITTAVLIVIGFLMRRSNKKEVRQEEPSIPPHEIALTAINRLKAKWEAHTLTPKQLHYALSDIVRIYLEGRFKIRATDRTLEEIRAALQSFSDLDDSKKALLMDLLSQTDLVKFTDYLLQEEEHMRLLSCAFLFVEQTTAQLINSS